MAGLLNRKTTAEANKSPLNAKRSLAGRTAVSPYDEAPTQIVDAETIDNELESDEVRQKLLEIKRKKNKQAFLKVLQVGMGILCAYIVFLIYGVLNTNYVYNARGRIDPLVMTVDQIRNLDEFKTMENQYLQARTLYENVLALDYRLGMGVEDPLLVAPEYEKLLTKVSSLAVQIGALTVPPQYTQPMNMLLSWVKNDLALYCQYISRAITQNSVNDMKAALQYKDTMYQNFKMITQVVSTLGTKVDNVDLTGIISWSPEGYVEQIGGI